ncbi:MAG: hypothetical protein GXO93_03940 [FCB group bacterium]|nr:hypothetical protein [FCB group bacterium]
MALKRATFFTYGTDDKCNEIQKFIEDAGVILDVRDIEKDPLTYEELEQLIGYLNVNHFLNNFSDAYTEFKLDKSLPTREEVIKLMARDHNLLRRPIIKTVRLMTVGYNKRKIAEMLQINYNGNNIEQENEKRNTRESNNRSGIKNKRNHTSSVARKR